MKREKERDRKSDRERKELKRGRKQTKEEKNGTAQKTLKTKSHFGVKIPHRQLEVFLSCMAWTDVAD